MVIEYKVIRLIEVSGKQIIDQKLWGGLPFAPLMQPPEGTPSGNWLRHCVQTADELALERMSKSDFLTDLAILNGLVYNYRTITDIISEETMFESVVAQKLAERGIRKQSIEDVLDVLEIRFDSSTVEPLKPNIEAIEELQILKQLHRSAVQSSNLDEFKKILDSIARS
ncbi:hypothetical protein HYR99_35780 [Candidatus Poribacteria bacterium]|nr:hypothetical protein [Candidatus Poribacteria bacterium]